MGQKTHGHQGAQDVIRYFAAILGMGSAKVVLYTLSSNPSPQTQPLCQSISSGSGLRVGAMVLMKVETGHPKPLRRAGLPPSPSSPGHPLGEGYRKKGR